MNRLFWATIALGLWANAAATIVHAAWTNTRPLTSIDAKLANIEESLARISAGMPSRSEGTKR